MNILNIEKYNLKQRDGHNSVAIYKGQTLLFVVGKGPEDIGITIKAIAVDKFEFEGNTKVEVHAEGLTLYILSGHCEIISVKDKVTLITHNEAILKVMSAEGSSKVYAYDKSSVTAISNVVIHAYNESYISVYKGVTSYTYDDVKVVDAYNTNITALDNTYIIKADFSEIKLSDNAFADKIYKTLITLTGNAKANIFNNSIAVITDKFPGTVEIYKDDSSEARLEGYPNFNILTKMLEK